MQILNKKPKIGEITIKTENLDDIWLLYKLLEKEDFVSGSTQRKIKIGDASEDRNAKIIFKWMNLEITAEKTSYESESKQLRITGPITIGNEDVSRGEYHSFLVEPQTQVTIRKEKWYAYQIQKLEDATIQQGAMLVCLFDREQALFGTITKQGYSQLTAISGSVTKKGADESKENFYEKIAKLLQDYYTKIQPQTIFCASAHFWQEYLKHELQLNHTELFKKTKFVVVHEVNQSGVEELQKTKEFSQAQAQSSQTKAISLFEDVLKHIANEGTATYGLSEVKKAAETGAVNTILVSNNLISKLRERNEFDKLDHILKTVDDASGEIHIVDETSTIIDKLDGLGGIVALLRYKI